MEPMDRKELNIRLAIEKLRERPEDLANYTDAFKNINNGNNMTIVVKNQTEWKNFTNIFPDYVTIKEPEPKFSSE